MYGWYTKRHVDFIGRQENLVDDLIEVLSIMNIKFDEDYIRNRQKVGVSPKKELIWDEGLKKQVALTESSAMIRYKYQEALEDFGLDFYSSQQQ
jgi:hypothetical protein